MVRFGFIFFPSELITRQAIDDLRMPTEDLNRIASVNDDTKQVEEGLKVWKTKTDDIINKLAELTDGFVNDFKTSVKGEWEVVKEKLEKSLLGASSQDRLVSIQITNQLRLNSRFRESSPAGWSIDSMSIPISVIWRDLLSLFKHNMLTIFSILYLKAVKNSWMLLPTSPMPRSPMPLGR